MEALIAELKATPRQPGVEKVYYPGELEARSEARLAADGIPVPDATADDLERNARDLGIAFPG